MLNDLRMEPEPTTADKLNLYSLEELAKETALDFGLPINVIKNNDIFCSEKKKKSENYLIYSYDNNRITLIKEMPVREHFSIEVDKHKINVNYIIWSNDLSRLVEGVEAEILHRAARRVGDLGYVAVGVVDVLSSIAHGVALGDAVHGIGLTPCSWTV